MGGLRQSDLTVEIVDSRRRDVRVVEGACLEIALAVSDGVLRISISVAEPTT